MYRFALALVAIVPIAQADIINVPTDQPTIQAGIDAAKDGDEVVVAPGEYFENLNMMGKAITLRSTNPDDAATVVATVINGGGAGTVITCNSGEPPSTLISGFVVTNGAAALGGGVNLFSNSSPTFQSCTFQRISPIRVERFAA